MECDRNICFKQDYNGGCKSCPCNEEAEPQLLVENEEAKIIREFADRITKEFEEEAERWHESGTEFSDPGELGVAGGFRYAIEIVRKAVESYECMR